MKKQANPQNKKSEISKFKNYKELISIFPEERKIKKFIGKRIKEERKKRKLKMHDLEEKAGLSHGVIANLEARGSSSFLSLLKVLSALGMDFNELLQVENKQKATVIDIEKLIPDGDKDELQLLSISIENLIQFLKENRDEIGMSLNDAFIGFYLMSKNIPELIKIARILNPEEYEIIKNAAKHLLSMYSEKEIYNRLHPEIVIVEPDGTKRKIRL